MSSVSTFSTESSKVRSISKGGSSSIMSSFGAETSSGSVSKSPSIKSSRESSSVSEDSGFGVNGVGDFSFPGS